MKGRFQEINFWSRAKTLVRTQRGGASNQGLESKDFMELKRGLSYLGNHMMYNLQEYP